MHLQEKVTFFLGGWSVLFPNVGVWKSWIIRSSVFSAIRGNNIRVCIVMEPWFATLPLISSRERYRGYIHSYFLLRLSCVAYRNDARLDLLIINVSAWHSRAKKLPLKMGRQTYFKRRLFSIWWCATLFCIHNVETKDQEERSQLETKPMCLHAYIQHLGGTKRLRSSQDNEKEEKRGGGKTKHICRSLIVGFFSGSGVTTHEGIMSQRTKDPFEKFLRAGLHCGGFHDFWGGGWFLAGLETGLALRWKSVREPLKVFGTSWRVFPLRQPPSISSKLHHLVT